MNDILATVNLTKFCHQAHNLLEELKIVDMLKVVTINDKGKTIDHSQHEVTRQIELRQNVILEMVSIPGGKFDMGSLENEHDKPQHGVTIKPFYMGKYPITQAQWKMVMGNNPSEIKGENLQVTNVSWDEAGEFCEKLSKLTGLGKKGYRLPSEAEWEYACRAGTTKKFHFGDVLSKDKANYKNEKTTPVGSFSHNAFGLYDMHGNVSEWCEDNWHDKYEISYQQKQCKAPTDGSAWKVSKNKNRVVRGGSWKTDDSKCRSASRHNVAKNEPSYDDLGFRVVRSVD